MKLNKILLGFLGLGLLASCSQDDVAPGGGTNTESKPDGYIAVNLQLPTTSGSRANDEFADGEDSEWSVKEGILVLFKGEVDDEDAATYIGAYDLGFPKAPDNDNTQGGNVTTTYKRAVKVSNLNLEGKRMYGLVFLNNRNAGISLDENGLKIGNTTCALNTTTFEDVLALSTQTSMINANNKPGEVASSIFMTNAPLASVEGGVTAIASGTDPGIKTLVDLTDGLQDSEDEALNNPAGTIYVERGVGKVTCSKILGAESIGSGIRTGLKVDIDGESKELIIKSIEWGIGNGETESYIVKNVKSNDLPDIDWTLNCKRSTSNAPYWRMISEKKLIPNIDATTPSPDYLYRTYWCYDKNYNVANRNLNITGESNGWDSSFTTVDGGWVGGNAQAFYPFENTFTIDAMNYGNTTRVGFWIQFAIEGKNGPVTFYTRNEDKSILYLDVTRNGKTQNPLIDDVLSDLTNDNALEAKFKNSLKDLTGTDGENSIYVNWGDDLFVAVSEIQADGLLKLTSLKLNDSCKEYFKTENDFNAFNNSLSGMISTFNSTYGYRRYDDGKAFYDVRIKHFGDDLTPWEKRSSSSIDESYPNGDGNRENNWFGRYGIVRNNWYDLQIDQLTKLGDPRDPATWDSNWGGTPDDNNPQYLAVRIAILSWAKRVQSVEF